MNQREQNCSVSNSLRFFVAVPLTTFNLTPPSRHGRGRQATKSVFPVLNLDIIATLVTD